MENHIKQVFLSATNNLSWLKKGDTVLIKPSLNSGNPYPATTHPLAVKVVADEIKKHGGQPVIGDMSGIGHVLQGPKGSVRGSSRKLYINSGMGNNPHPFVAFEEEDWHSDFFLHKSALTKSWPNGFYATKWLKKADHIIALPRLSTHGQGGVTLGFKNFVGVLREDSRVEFHAQGPFGFFIKAATVGSGLKTRFAPGGDFFSKIVEISDALRSKLRLTLFVATKAQTNFGPDSGFVVSPETGYILASSDQLAADVIATLLLTYWYQQIPQIEKIKQRLYVKLNGRIKELGREKVWSNPFIKHALLLGWGSKDISLESTGVEPGLPLFLEKKLDFS